MNKKLFLFITALLLTMVLAPNPVIAPHADSVWATGSVVFNDVAPDSVYYDAVKYLKENAITVGTTTNNFEPDKLIKVKDFATLILRSKNIVGLSENANDNLRIFIKLDYGLTSLANSANVGISRRNAYALILNTYEEGIYSGTEASLLDMAELNGFYDGTSDVNSLLTRGEAALLVYKMSERETLENLEFDVLSEVKITYHSMSDLNELAIKLEKVPDVILKRFNARGWEIIEGREALEEALAAAGFGKNYIGLSSYTHKTIWLERDSAAIHEIGHFLHGQLNYPVEIDAFYAEEAKSAATLMRKYTGTDVYEFFADYFDYWISNSGNADKMRRLKAATPKTYEYFENLEKNNWGL
jgi:hypothetical protein